CPVTFRASGEARKTAIAAISSGDCQRLSGTRRRIFSADHCSQLRRVTHGWVAAQASLTERFNGVSTMPGLIVLTRTPLGARSRAAHWAKLIRAAFEAL